MYQVPQWDMGTNLDKGNLPACRPLFLGLDTHGAPHSHGSLFSQMTALSCTTAFRVVNRLGTHAGWSCMGS